MKQGIYVSLDGHLFSLIERYAEDMEWSKAQALRKIITIFFQEDLDGDYKNNREARRSKHKKG